MDWVDIAVDIFAIIATAIVGVAIIVGVILANGFSYCVLTHQKCNLSDMMIYGLAVTWLICFLAMMFKKEKR